MRTFTQINGKMVKEYNVDYKWFQRGSFNEDKLPNLKGSPYGYEKGGSSILFINVGILI